MNKLNVALAFHAGCFQHFFVTRKQCSCFCGIQQYGRHESLLQTNLNWCSAEGCYRAIFDLTWNTNSKFFTCTLVSAYYQRRGISAHRLTTYHGPQSHQTTSFVSTQPHSSAHLRGLLHMLPFTVMSRCHPVIHLVWTEDVDLVVLVPVGQTSFVTTLGLVPTNLWRQAVLRGHGGATQLPELATRWRQRPYRPRVHAW